MDLKPGAAAGAIAPPAAGTARALGWLLSLRPHEVELLHPVRRVPPLGWVLLVVGLAALLMSVLTLRPELGRRAELARTRAELEAALDRLGVRPTPGGAPGVHAGRSEVLLEGQQLVGELHRPWHEFFDQLETAVAGEKSAVHVVQLSVDPRFGTVQLIAEARGLDKLVHFSQRLSGGAPIRSMTLTNYEWRDALGGHVVSAAMQGELVLAPAPAATLSLAAAGSSK